MLDAFIIEHLKRKEEDADRDQERPVLHLPLPIEDDELIDEEEIEVPTSNVIILEM